MFMAVQSRIIWNSMRSYQPQLVTSCSRVDTASHPSIMSSMARHFLRIPNPSTTHHSTLLANLGSLVVIPVFFCELFASLNKAVFVLCTLMPCWLGMCTSCISVCRNSPMHVQYITEICIPLNSKQMNGVPSRSTPILVYNKRSVSEKDVAPSITYRFCRG